MDKKYYLVCEEVLPALLKKVIKVKEIIANGSVKDVSEAVKAVGISRSTYYKYRDFIMPANNSISNKKLTIIISMVNETGVLSEVLDCIASESGSIITINQDIPFNFTANVTITIDISKITCNATTLIEKVKTLENVVEVKMLAIE